MNEAEQDTEITSDILKELLSTSPIHISIRDETPDEVEATVRKSKTKKKLTKEDENMQVKLNLVKQWSIYNIFLPSPCFPTTKYTSFDTSKQHSSSDGYAILPPNHLLRYEYPEINSKEWKEGLAQYLGEATKKISGDKTMDTTVKADLTRFINQALKTKDNPTSQRFSGTNYIQLIRAYDQGNSLSLWLSSPEDPAKLVLTYPLGGGTFTTLETIEDAGLVCNDFTARNFSVTPQGVFRRFRNDNSPTITKAWTRDSISQLTEAIMQEYFSLQQEEDQGNIQQEEDNQSL
jgi:hypothetical protein